MEKKFEYRGSLAVTPLPEILATIERYRVPGALRVSSGDRHRRIFLDSGVVVFAASDEPEVRLGNYLIRRGRLPEEAVRSAETRLAGDGVRLGQILMTLELLDRPTLDAAIGEQVREILWGAFEWESGEVVFDVGSRSAEEPIRIDLPIADVILEGIRRSSAVKRFIDRLGAGHSVLERSNGGAREGLLTEPESAYLEAVDGRTPLQALCRKGPGTVSENARLLYAFFCLDLVRVKEALGVRKLQWRTEGGALGESD